MNQFNQKPEDNSVVHKVKYEGAGCKVAVDDDLVKRKEGELHGRNCIKSAKSAKKLHF